MYIISYVCTNESNWIICYLLMFTNTMLTMRPSIGFAAASQCFTVLQTSNGGLGSRLSALKLRWQSGHGTRGLRAGVDRKPESRGIKGEIRWSFFILLKTSHEVNTVGDEPKRFGGHSDEWNCSGRILGISSAWFSNLNRLGTHKEGAKKTSALLRQTP